MSLSAVWTVECLCRLQLESETSKFSLYTHIRHLSIDVAVGALCGGSMVAAYLAVPMHWSWYVILPLSVWAIYTGDHLMDARRLGDAASTPRHRFHHRHFRLLLVLALLAAMTSVVLASVFLGVTGVLFGLGLGVLAGAHLALVKFVGERNSPLLVKELGVALVYSAGIWGLPLIMSGALATREAMVPAAQFLLLALANLLEFSLYEFDSDKRDGHTSLVQAIGRKGTIRFTRLVLAAAVGLGVYLLASTGGAATVRLETVYALMAGVLAALIYRPVWFMHHERYRVWGDAAFLLPVLYILWTIL